MATSKKVVYSESRTVVDFKTGEIAGETKNTTIRIPTEPAYIKMYIDDLCAIENVPNALKSTLLALLKKLDYAGYITLSKRFRKEVCKELKIEDGTLRNRLTALCKSNLLHRDSTNEYMVNPNYFARGDWKTICEKREEFELRIKYSEKGRSITTKALGDKHLQQSLSL